MKKLDYLAAEFEENPERRQDYCQNNVYASCCTHLLLKRLWYVIIFWDHSKEHQKKQREGIIEKLAETELEDVLIYRETSNVYTCGPNIRCRIFLSRVKQYTNTNISYYILKNNNYVQISIIKEDHVECDGFNTWMICLVVLTQL